MVIFDCPNIIMEQLAEQATHALGFRVIVSSLRTSIEGTVVRSFDYEWYPTPEYEERPPRAGDNTGQPLQRNRAGGKPG